jgi:outer membrane receptor protein involved in Fe transport
MVRRIGLLASTATAAFLLSHPACSQEAPAEPPPPGPVSAWLSSVEFGGRIEAGATFNPASPDTGVNFGQLFTDKANQLVLNQFDLNVQRVADATPGGFDLGFAIDGLYGMDSQFTHFLGIGDQGSTGRNSFDIVQGNVDLMGRVSPGLAFDARAGLFVTPMGFEKLDPTRNFFYSNSYIFNFGLPRKHTGLLTTTQVGSWLDIYLGYTTGANTSVGPGGGYDDGQAHLLAGASARWNTVSVEAFTHIGPEDTPRGLPPGVDPHTSNRYYDDLFVTWAITPRLFEATELNYVRDDGLNADAGGVAQYLTYDISRTLSVGARAEVWRDAEGAFVAGYPGNLDYLDVEEGLPNTAFRPGPATYGEVTLGLNVRPRLDLELGDREIDAPFGQVVLRPEVRFDRVLAGDSGFGAVPGSARGQVTIAFDIVVPLSFQHATPPGTDTGPETGPKTTPWPETPFPAPASNEAALAPRPDADEAPLPARDGDAIDTIPGAAETAGTQPPSRQGRPGPIDASASFIGAGAFDLTDPQTLQDLNGYAPALALGQSPTGDLTPYIRGMGDGAPHTGQAPAVSLELNGVAIDGAFAQLLNPADVYGMRVAYGPSGLFGGRDATAGTVDFATLAPTRAWGVDAEYSLEQGFHASNARVRLDAPVGETAGVSLFLSHQQRGGYENDVYSGETLYGRDETTLGALRFDWSLTPDLTADLGITLAHGDGQGTPFALGDTLDEQQLGPLLTAVSPNLAFNTYGSPYLMRSTQPLGAYQTAADGANGQSVTGQLYSLTLTDQSSVGRLTSITAFLHETIATGQDLDGGCGGSDLGGLACPFIANPLVDVLQLSTSQAYDQFSEDLRLEHDFGAFAESRIGAYLIADRTDHGQATRTADDPAAPATPALQSSDQREADYALFAELTVHPIARLSISGGVRWVEDHESYALADGGVGAPSLTGSQSQGRLLSRFAADYRLWDGVSLYAQRSTGFRPGGLSLGSTLAEQIPGQPNYDPADPAAEHATFGAQTDVDYEGGFKFALAGGRLSGRLTGYDTTIDGMQTPELVLTPGFDEAIATYVVNLPRVETRGAEADFAWKPLWVAGLTLSGEGAYEDARITDGLVPAAATPVNAMATAGSAGALYDLTGTPLANTPRFSGTARADYVRPLGPGALDLEVAYQWTDRYALAVSGGQGDFQPALGLLGFSVGYQRSFYKISVTARNLLNQIYFGDAVPAYFAHTWGVPRTVVVSLEAKF